MKISRKARVALNKIEINTEEVCQAISKQMEEMYQKEYGRERIITTMQNFVRHEFEMLKREFGYFDTEVVLKCVFATMRKLEGDVD